MFWISEAPRMAWQNGMLHQLCPWPKGSWNGLRTWCLGYHKNLVWIWAFPLTRCVTLSEYLNLAGLQFLHRWKALLTYHREVHREDKEKMRLKGWRASPLWIQVITIISHREKYFRFFLWVIRFQLPIRSLMTLFFGPNIRTPNLRPSPKCLPLMVTMKNWKSNHAAFCTGAIPPN